MGSYFSIQHFSSNRCGVIRIGDSMNDVIFEIGTYDSGIDCGDVGYSFRPLNLEKLCDDDLARVVRMIDEHRLTVQRERKRRGIQTSIYYKYREIIDLRYFPLFKKGYSMAPISFGWSRRSSHSFICAHGWQNGYLDGKRLYGWTLHIGALKIKFGKTKRDI